jgi:3-oxoacyl-[acyl-carrier protein] reductase
MKTRMKNKVCVVTGAATGIGKATALMLADHGAQVIVADINLEGAKGTVSEILDQGSEAYALHLDLSDLHSISCAVETVMSRYGRLDVLVNNAGLFSTVAIPDMTEENWDAVMDVNLKGTFFLCKAVLPHMIEQRYGKIVNLSSLAAKRGGVTSGINYAASKSGILSVTTCLAKYSASFGITVNAIIPAFCDTSMFRSLPQKKIDDAINGIPMGRPARPEELASAIMFLSSDESSYITGEILDVNGGVLMD